MKFLDAWTATGWERVSVGDTVTFRRADGVTATDVVRTVFWQTIVTEPYATNAVVPAVVLTAYSWIEIRHITKVVPVEPVARRTHYVGQYQVTPCRHRPGQWTVMIGTRCVRLTRPMVGWKWSARLPGALEPIAVADTLEGAATRAADYFSRKLRARASLTA